MSRRATTRSLRRCASVALLVVAAVPALSASASAEPADGPPDIVGNCYTIELYLPTIGQDPSVDVCVPDPVTG